MKVKIKIAKNEYYKEKYGNATCGEYDYDTKKVTIYKGTPISDKVFGTSDSLELQKRILKEQGVIDDEKFLKDHVFAPGKRGTRAGKKFTGLSAAATIVLNRNSSGFYEFCTETNESIEGYESVMERAGLLNGQNEDSNEARDEINRLVQEDLAAQGLLSQSTIFYGIPGCGKSYEIKKLLHLTKDYQTQGRALAEKYYSRVLFHPEYGYGEFVGQIMPKTEGERIRYAFEAGPFVEILAKALTDPDNHYFLVIEELNRGNAPAIFGDLFQLLDREDGESEYPVTNRQITEYLKETRGIDVDKVSIPCNLTILATMNTCDQNLFSLDTAFKRRWQSRKLLNPVAELSEDKIGGDWIAWKDFAQALNADMLTCCKEGMIVEDKLLGAYFVKKREIENIQIFAEKVIAYLWNDVVKINKRQLFAQGIDTLDEAIERFVRRENIFSAGCEKWKALYERAE